MPGLPWYTRQTARVLPDATDVCPTRLNLYQVIARDNRPNSGNAVTGNGDGDIGPESEPVQCCAKAVCREPQGQGYDNEQRKLSEPAAGEGVHVVITQGSWGITVTGDQRDV